MNSLDMKNIGIAIVGSLLLILIMFFVIRSRESYVSDRTNTAFNNSPKFWNWKNIKSQLK